MSSAMVRRCNHPDIVRGYGGSLTICYSVFQMLMLVCDHPFILMCVCRLLMMCVLSINATVHIYVTFSVLVIIASFTCSHIVEST